MNDYEQRKQDRIDRLRERADKARAQSDALSRQSWNMIHAIPGGQPIMGSADARYRERADNKMRQSVAASDKADYPPLLPAYGPCGGHHPAPRRETAAC